MEAERTVDELGEYFQNLETELNHAMSIAIKARSMGMDPHPEPEILLAKDLADRVENLVGIPDVAERIRQIEKEADREETALLIGQDFAEGLIGSKEKKLQIAEEAIRTSMAILTEGVVAAPIEGISKVDTGINDDGGKYLRVFYAGPIRSAGGTAQALSVLVADYVRRKLGFAAYKPRNEEVERYVEEIIAYEQAKSLQYTPSEDEIRLIVSNCPVCIDGDPTEEEEVDGYRNLERVDTDRIRGGVALVIAEGLALKAPKVKKHVDRLDLDEWDWLTDLMNLSHSESDDVGEDSKHRKFLDDILAGRPIFAYPAMEGGFRLRYGRSRNTGLATAGMHPATMLILDDFIAPGTQMKVELPGKAAGISPVDSIEGPTVRLINGDVVRVDSIEDALSIRDKISHILDVGEILVNYGDFLENNHPLVPGAYCAEWWEQELELACDGEEIDFNPEDISVERAVELSERFHIPLHPAYIYLWHDVSLEELELLAAHISNTGTLNQHLELQKQDDVKNLLETLLVPHKIRSGKIIIEEPLPLIRCLALGEKLNKEWSLSDLKDCEDTLEAVSKLSGITIRAKAPTRIGSRMGRPEKSKERLMKPPPHVLFPVGKGGGKTRSIQNASEYASGNLGAGKIELEVGVRRCTQCGTETFRNKCECGAHTIPVLHCPYCDLHLQQEECPKCGRVTTSVAPQVIDIGSLYQEALACVQERGSFSTFKGVEGLISKHKTPEPLEKGVLRAKHGVHVFKDATIRYDATNLPLTHFTPGEIGTGIKRLRELGYKQDIYGEPLTKEDQILELRPQDVIPSTAAGDYLVKVAGFIDDLLVKYYNLESYHNAKSKEDLIGALVIGLAPHTSAGVLGRIIGFTSASVGYAHPYFHAAKRRNCDGDEDALILLLDGLINFSKEYLPDRRGGRIMDAPVVLSTRINPNEIDSEAHNIDVMERYPLELYEAAQRRATPKELEDKIDLISHRLGTNEQYHGLRFTHHTTDIALGPANSAYKTLGSMTDKMEAQLYLARKLRAVDASDVAERVITSHFIPDIMGNLRAFSRQKVRCVKCNAKYRRPPLAGKCLKCGARVILTVNEGGVRKYLEVSRRVAEEYQISDYTKQRLELLRNDVRSLFESDVSKQTGLAEFM